VRLYFSLANVTAQITTSRIGTDAIGTNRRANPMRVARSHNIRASPIRGDAIPNHHAKPNRVANHHASPSRLANLRATIPELNFRSRSR
jgi:hypothetical protein